MKSLTNYLRAYRWQDHTTTIINKLFLYLLKKVVTDAMLVVKI